MQRRNWNILQFTNQIVPFSKHCDSNEKIDELKHQEDDCECVAGHKWSSCPDVQLVCGQRDRGVCRNYVVMLFQWPEYVWEVGHGDSH